MQETSEAGDAQIHFSIFNGRPCDALQEVLKVLCIEHNITSAEQLRERLEALEDVPRHWKQARERLEKERDELRAKLAAAEGQLERFRGMEAQGDWVSKDFQERHRWEHDGEMMTCCACAELRAEVERLRGLMQQAVSSEVARLSAEESREFFAIERSGSRTVREQIQPSATASAPPAQRGVVVRCDSGWDD